MVLKYENFEEDIVSLRKTHRGGVGCDKLTLPALYKVTLITGIAQKLLTGSTVQKLRTDVVKVK